MTTGAMRDALELMEREPEGPISDETEDQLISRFHRS